MPWVPQYEVESIAHELNMPFNDVILPSDAYPRGRACARSGDVLWEVPANIANKARAPRKPASKPANSSGQPANNSPAGSSGQPVSAPAGSSGQPAPKPANSSPASSSGQTSSSPVPTMTVADLEQKYDNGRKMLESLILKVGKLERKVEYHQQQFEHMFNLLNRVEPGYDKGKGYARSSKGKGNYSGYDSGNDSGYDKGYARSKKGKGNYSANDSGNDDDDNYSGKRGTYGGKGKNPYQ